MILKYLIPVKLSIGILPNHRLLEKYNLLEVCLMLIDGLFFSSLSLWSTIKVYCLIFLIVNLLELAGGNFVMFPSEQ